MIAVPIPILSPLLHTDIVFTLRNLLLWVLMKSKIKQKTVAQDKHPVMYDFVFTLLVLLVLVPLETESFIHQVDQNQSYQ